MSGPQSRSGRGGEEKKNSPCWESNPGRPARSPVPKLTSVPRFQKSDVQV